MTHGPPGITCGRGFGAFYGSSGYSSTEHLPPKAFLLENGLVCLTGLVEKQGQAVWHKGDALAQCDERYRPAVRAVFHVMGQFNQVRL